MLMIVARGIAALAAAATWSAPALAHHPMGGALPTAWWQGLLSGLGHPIIGPDHLAFLLAAALLTIGRPRPLLILAGFVIASLAGVLIHVALVTALAIEPVVAASVLVAGLALLAMRKVDDRLFASLLILAGLFHGYAFGESIVGAERTPIIAYLCGLALIQFAVAWGALTVATILSLPAARPLACRGIGAAIAVLGVVILGQAVA
jgi:urease accessory protein